MCILIHDVNLQENRSHLHLPVYFRDRNVAKVCCFSSWNSSVSTPSSLRSLSFLRSSKQLLLIVADFMGEIFGLSVSLDALLGVFGSCGCSFFTIAIAAPTRASAMVSFCFDFVFGPVINGIGGFHFSP